MTIYLGSTDFQSHNNLQVKTKKITEVQYTQKASQKDDDSFLSDKCTDGKDDGKIGLFNAAGHIVKGAGKTLIDTVKGCFTDENGDLSIGKTLLTAGTAAACLAFPPLGLVACAVGATLGAIKIGNGVYNAATAKTDAEAKKAWQEVGGGALTAGASAVGAKSSLGAIKATSTAGKAGGSAFGELEENASIAQKAAALGKDAISSTKNRASSIKDSALEAKDTLKAAKEAVDYKKVKAKADSLQDAAKEKISTAQDISSSVKESIKHPVDTIKSGIAKIKDIKLSDIKTKLSDKAKLAFNAIKEKGYSTALKDYGYEAVHEALTAAAGVTVADKSI